MSGEDSGLFALLLDQRVVQQHSVPSGCEKASRRSPLVIDARDLGWSRFFGQCVKVYANGGTGGSEMAKRRRFTPRFEAQVAQEALREERTVQQIAARHGVHPNQTSQWKRKAVKGWSNCSTGVDRTNQQGSVNQSMVPGSIGT